MFYDYMKAGEYLIKLLSKSKYFPQFGYSFDFYKINESNTVFRIKTATNIGDHDDKVDLEFLIGRDGRVMFHIVFDQIDPILEVYNLINEFNNYHFLKLVLRDDWHLDLRYTDAIYKGWKRFFYKHALMSALDEFEQQMQYAAADKNLLALTKFTHK